MSDERNTPGKPSRWPSPLMTYQRWCQFLNGSGVGNSVSDRAETHAKQITRKVDGCTGGRTPPEDEEQGDEGVRVRSAVFSSAGRNAP